TSNWRTSERSFWRYTATVSWRVLVTHTLPLASSTPTPYTANTAPPLPPGTSAGVILAVTLRVFGSSLSSCDWVTGGRPTAAVTNTALLAALYADWYRPWTSLAEVWLKFCWP